MRPNGLELLLIRWAEAIQAELDNSAYAKSSTIYRLMRMGPDGASIHSATIQLPNYWPDADVRSINEAVWGMQIEYRNALVLAYILRCSLSEAGEQQGITKDKARHRLERAKKFIEIRLHNLD
jgi:hypothetical protein